MAGSQWITLRVPLAQLGNLKTIKRINVQDLGGSSPLSFYVDEIDLLPRTQTQLAMMRSPHYTIFANLLAREWRDASQGAQVSFIESQVVRRMYAIAVQLTQPGGKFRVEPRQPLDVGEFKSLSFYVHGEEAGSRALRPTGRRSSRPSKPCPASGRRSKWRWRSSGRWSRWRSLPRMASRSRPSIWRMCGW